MSRTIGLSPTSSVALENRPIESDHHTSTAGRTVLFLITTLTYGGAETQVVRLALEMQKLGWRVSVVCMLDPTNYVGILEDAGIPVHSLGMPRGIPDPRGLVRLAALIRQTNPDVLHSHMVHANLLGRLVRLVAPVPVVISTVHNFRETSERGGPTWYKEALYRITDALADRTTIISESAFERYVAVGAVPRAKLEMLPNGVDTKRFQPSAEQRAKTRAELGLGRDFVWLAVGRLVEQKDYPNLLRAARLLPPEGWQILIMGEGMLQADLSRLAVELGVADRVRFLSAREDVLGIYSCADGFVMSSEFEGMSAALQEAIAMALPCVVTNVGANADLVIDGVSGFVVPPADSAALAAAMQKLSSADPSERQRFGERARRLAVSTYEFGIIAAKWVDLYRRCHAAKGQRSQF
jgi:glycosyltransferase involved in cell wall biosynthesis